MTFSVSNQPDKPGRKERRTSHVIDYVPSQCAIDQMDLMGESARITQDINLTTSQRLCYKEELEQQWLAKYSTMPWWWSDD